MVGRSVELVATGYNENVEVLTSGGALTVGKLGLAGSAIGSGDQMKVTVVYESMEAMERHANGLTPILEDMSIDPGEPEVFETHNLMRRGE